MDTPEQLSTSGISSENIQAAQPNPAVSSPVPKPKNKMRIASIVIIGIITVCVVMGLISIVRSPRSDQSKANDSKRGKDASLIQDALTNYIVDENNGEIPTFLPTKTENISKSGADICKFLVPKYTNALPQDPSINEGKPITDCNSKYDTGYTISYNKSGNLSSFESNITINTPLVEVGNGTFAIINSSFLKEYAKRKTETTIEESVAPTQANLPPTMNP
jgi:hypothetical protein